LFQALLSVKTDVFVGKFIDQTLHMVARVRARATLEIYWRPLRWRTHWCIISMIP